MRRSPARAHGDQLTTAMSLMTATCTAIAAGTAIGAFTVATHPSVGDDPIRAAIAVTIGGAVSAVIAALLVLLIDRFRKTRPDGLDEITAALALELGVEKEKLEDAIVRVLTGTRRDWREWHR
ncbi:exported hypothetical protein [Nitrosopumilaceae archaeon]|nr:exported hypothetical protein [Nitrosopumilaceae archaeon]